MNILRLSLTIIIVFLIIFITFRSTLAEKETSLSKLKKIITTIEDKFVDNVTSHKLLNAFIEGVYEELEKNKIIIKELRYFTISSDLEKDLLSLKTIFENNLPVETGISQEHIVHMGIEKMVSSLKDDGTKYYPPGQYHMKLMESSFKGGVGMFIDEEKDAAGNFIIVETLEGYPSFNAGLKSGDRIVNVDGKNVKELELHQLAELVIGEIGTKFTLTVKQKNKEEPQEITLERVALNPNPKTIIWKTLEDSIGYIKFKFLGFRMEQETWNVLQSLSDEKIKALIIDLRDNAGYPGAAISLAGLFLPPGTPIATEVSKNSQNLFVAKNENHFRLPLVILIDKYSASASSIFAEALRYAHRAKIVGTPSRWRYNCNEKFSMDDGSVLTVSTHYYELPDQTILRTRKEAIKPDIEVMQEQFLNDPTKDLQLQKAIELLKEEIKSPGK